MPDFSNTYAQTCFSQSSQLPCRMIQSLSHRLGSSSSYLPYKSSPRTQQHNIAHTRVTALYSTHSNSKTNSAHKTMAKVSFFDSFLPRDLGRSSGSSNSLNPISDACGENNEGWNGVVQQSRVGPQVHRSSGVGSSMTYQSWGPAVCPSHNLVACTEMVVVFKEVVSKELESLGEDLTACSRLVDRSRQLAVVREVQIQCYLATRRRNKRGWWL
jgi:hypothetical protein